MPWLDESALSVGQRWRTKVVEILRQVNCIVVCCGPKGLGPLQEMELLYYRDHGSDNIFPVRLDSVEKLPELPDYLNRRHMLDLGHGETELKRLVDKINEANLI